MSLYKKHWIKQRRQTKVVQGKPLALPPSDNTEAIVTGEFTLSDKYYKKIEQAGFAYLQLQRSKLKKRVPRKKKQDERIKEEVKEDFYDFSKDEGEKQEKTEEDDFREKMFGENLYELLGIGHLSMAAKESEIKKAYRKMALKYHPDKQDPNRKATPEQLLEEKEMWLKVQNAEEILMNEKKRKTYDSTLHFDDAVPIEPIDDKQFFELFMPVFKRNAVWSRKEPVPILGNKDTPYHKVEKFYKFWRSFDSWRDFPQDDEHDLDQAENRWERRQMEKENKEMKKELLKAEKVRIVQMVELAFKHDIRVQAEFLRQSQEQERRKQAKFDRKKRAKQELIERQKKYKEDQERKVLEAKQAILKEERKAKKQQEKLIKLSNQLIEILQDKVVQEGYSHKFFQNMCKLMQKKELKKGIKLFTEVEKDKALSLFKEFYAQLMVKFKKRNNGKTVILGDYDDLEWSEKERHELSKLMRRFPVGSRNRWDLVANGFKNKKRSKEAIIKQAKSMTRMDKVKNYKQALKVEKKQNKTVVQEERKTYVVEDPNAWSQEQQQAFEKALKSLPRNMDKNQRWKKISEAVKGKNIKQCVKRFKFLRETLKKKRQEQQTKQFGQQSQSSK